MKIYSLIFSLITLLFSLELKAQNAFTFAGNGTFETPESDWLSTLQSTSSSLGITNATYSQSSSHWKEGTHSLKVVQKITSTSNRSVAFPFSPGSGHYAGASVWVYIPSSENSTISGADISYNTAIDAFTSGAPGLQAKCNFKGGDLWLDRWVQINPVLLENFVIIVNGQALLLANGSFLTYYLDKIETVVDKPIAVDDPVFAETSITLDQPTGGIQVIQGTEPSGTDTNGSLYYGTIYSQTELGFTYTWSDPGAPHTPYRTDLIPGTIYTVTIVNQIGNCSVQNDFRFVVGHPPIPIANDVTICENTATTLTASGAVQSYQGYFWYDTPVGGTTLNNPPTVSSSSLSVGPLERGEHKYYVQMDITGDIRGLSSERKEVVVTVSPSPLSQLQYNAVVYKGKPLTIKDVNYNKGYTYNSTFTYVNGSNTAAETNSNSTGEISYTFHNFGQYVAPGTHPVQVIATSDKGCPKVFSFNVEVKDYIPLCEAMVISNSNKIKLDKFSGQYVFQSNSNCIQDFSLGCIQGKVKSSAFTNVISASATTFSDDWDYDGALYPSPFAQTNPYENGKKGKWRPDGNYVYKTDDVAYDKNYNSGTFTLNNFNWQYPKASTRTGWLQTSQVDQYSPNGEVIEEHNALKIKSVAKFGFDGSLPYLIAQNADYGSVLFESFEKAGFEDGVTATAGTKVTSYSHAGTSSLQVPSATAVAIKTFVLSDQIKNKGLLAKVWVRGNPSQLQLIVGNAAFNFDKKVKTGEWTLYSLELDKTKIPGNASVNLAIRNPSTSNILIDDLRIQPKNSEMTAYVYDPKTFRLLAVFDDQHFGLYYQYNVEGKLVRKLIETERGIKTVQETQYNARAKNNESAN